jgi:hypothetical protein
MMLNLAATNRPPAERQKALLRFLYGETRGAATLRELRELLARQAAVRTTEDDPRPLSGRDALLITYADQVRAPGQPSLRTLAEFAEASGLPHRINRAKFERARLESEPANPATLRARVFSGFCELLRARRNYAAFHPQGFQEVLHLDERVFGLRRCPPGGGPAVLCLHNVSAESVSLALPDGEEDGGRRWTPLLESHAVPACPNGGQTARLGPYQTAWLGETCNGS